jgi:hypothetical protein
LKTKEKLKISALSVSGQNPEYQDPKFLEHHDEIIKRLRWWQLEAFAKLKDERFAMAVAFCGSGKSILQVALAIYDIIKSDWNQKQLIVVPQSHISKGFLGGDGQDYITIEVEGVVYNWLVVHDFCDDKSKEVLANLKKWFLDDPRKLANGCVGGKMISGLNAVASHQAVGLVWKSMTKNERAKAIRNLTFRVDESHHVNGIYDEDDGDFSDEQKSAIDDERTNLGDICTALFNSNDKTSKMCMSTATPYRGDQGMIFSKKVKNQFKVYFLDWIEHFKTLGIAEFKLEYEEYVGDPIRQVCKNIAKEPKEKHLIVIPATGNKWRRNGQTELERLLKEVKKIVPANRILDLVTPATQDKNKALLLAEPKSGGKKKSNYDVVITCMLGREGTDWCPCSRMHNTSCGSSLTLEIQTIGRPFRRYEGKTMVLIYHYIQCFAKPKKGMTKRELLSDRTNALLVSMQMDEMCNPVKIPIMRPVQVSNGSGSAKNYMTLAEIFGDEFQNIKEDFIMDLECLADKTDEAIDGLIDAIISNEGVKENVDWVRDAMRVLATRLLAPPEFKLEIMGIDVSYIRKNGFDKLVEKYGLRGRSIFFAGYDAKDWEILRPIFKQGFNLDEFLVEWKEHQKEKELKKGKKLA